MIHHSIVLEIGNKDTVGSKAIQKGTKSTTLQLMHVDEPLMYGIGAFLKQLDCYGLHPSETSIDLLILASVITNVDAKISRGQSGPDGWTRSIDLHIPVFKPRMWREATGLLEHTLKFLTGDIWRVSFRKRSIRLATLYVSNQLEMDTPPEINCVCLFSGGLDSYVGAIDCLMDNGKPFFVSARGDLSTSNQNECLAIIRQEFSAKQHYLSQINAASANTRINRHGLRGLSQESTTRSRSFMFLTLATVVANAIGGCCPIYVPENGFISLNVPLDPLRIGSLSTRTTHPHYMANWKSFTSVLGLDVELRNPYQFMTKGEMLKQCRNQRILKAGIYKTMSCSSCTKARFDGKGKIHCGYCVPCLIRRAAIEHWCGKDKTDYWRLDPIDATAIDASRESGKHVRGFRMLLRRVRQKPQLINWLMQQPGPLNSFDKHELDKYVNVLTSGLAEVEGLVGRARFDTD